MRARSVANTLGHHLSPGHCAAGNSLRSKVHGKCFNGSRQNLKVWNDEPVPEKAQRIPSWEDISFLSSARSSSHSQASRVLVPFVGLLDCSRITNAARQDGSVPHSSLAGFLPRRSLQIPSHSPTEAAEATTQLVGSVSIANESDLLLGDTEKEAAMLALKQYLIDVKGESPEDADFVARNCPTFLAKLTSSGTSLERAESFQSCMRIAIEKEDKGASNESVATFVSAGDVSNSLLTLGDIVLWLKNPLAVAGHWRVRKSMRILDSLDWSTPKLREMLDRNPKLETLTVEELQTNISILEEVGVKRKDLQTFIEDPQVFMPDLREKLMPLLTYLDERGIGWHALGDLMRFNPQGLIKMPLASFKERVDFLLELGLSSSEVEKSMRSFPQLVHLRLSNLSQKMEFFDGIGVDRDSMVKIVAKLPSIFRHSIEKNLVPKVRLLENLGVVKRDLVKFIAQYPQFFGCSIENLRQKLAFFETNGLTGNRLVKMITWHPRAFSFSVDENLTKKLAFLVKKGFLLRSTSMVRALASCITISIDSLEARFQNLQALGFTETEVSDLVKKQPTIFCLSENTIRVKMDYLVNTMNRSRAEILKCPGYLLYSLELRIKPRQRVVALLTSKGLLREDVYSLSTILQPSEKTFVERFVNLDPECIEIYSDRSEETDIKTPSGVDVQFASIELVHTIITAAESSESDSSSSQDLSFSGNESVAMT